MKTILIVLTFAAVISTLGCGVIGQTPGGAVAPSIAVFKNVIAKSYDDHKTYDNIGITIPAGIKNTEYRVLFDIDKNGIDPATLDVAGLKKMDPEIQDRFIGVGKDEYNFISYNDITICFYNNGDKKVLLLTDDRPKFKIGNSPILEMPLSCYDLKSLFGEPERLLKRGELP